jgi:hypothetical protein
MAPPSSPPPPDSVVVRVYRADKLTQQKFEQKDSTGTRNVLANAKGADSTRAHTKDSTGTQRNDSSGTSPRP